MLLPLQGVTNERALTQGVASLALGYVLLPFQGALSCKPNAIKPISHSSFSSAFRMYSLRADGVRCGCHDEGELRSLW